MGSLHDPFAFLLHSALSKTIKRWSALLHGGPKKRRFPYDALSASSKFTHLSIF